MTELRLPDTEGEWVAEIARRGDIGREGSVIGWAEKFRSVDGTLKIVPFVSRWIPGNRHRG